MNTDSDLSEVMGGTIIGTFIDRIMVRTMEGSVVVIDAGCDRYNCGTRVCLGITHANEKVIKNDTTI